MKKSLISKYARLIAAVGANIQKDQEVIINAAADQHDFVTLVAGECYRLGASAVRVDWQWQPLTKLAYQYQSLKTLSTVRTWQKERIKEQVKKLPAVIHIVSEDPAGLAGIDMKKMQLSRQKIYPIIKPFRDAMENRHQWSIAAVPSAGWAKKVFPELSVSRAMEKLWGLILEICRVTEDNDPIEAWQQHNANFLSRRSWLNEKNFDKLTYRSANGTDFSAELIPEGQWCGGGETTIGGIFFNPNMPTEEIFTSPMKGKAEGTLVSTMPLSWQGQIIRDFSVTFRDGRAVSWKAAEGEELLNHMITLDDGASMLGELALVPKTSPISRSGVLFYETLFDENASCHVALGHGFNDCIQGYQTRSDEECKKLGINDSMSHVDFMIGSDDLCVTGWKDGIPTPVFINGDWAF